MTSLQLITSDGDVISVKVEDIAGQSTFIDQQLKEITPNPNQKPPPRHPKPLRRANRTIHIPVDVPHLPSTSSSNGARSTRVGPPLTNNHPLTINTPRPVHPLPYL